jgi:ribose/xylose/arabinose/galactoside ABC-type transport system permease subunit
MILRLPLIVTPSKEVMDAPKETLVVPIVIALLVNAEFGIFVSVLRDAFSVEPLIVTFDTVPPVIDTLLRVLGSD